jgi:phenylacetate-CoA ligase
MPSTVQALTTLYSLLRHPGVGREQIVAFQNERVQRLIHHAYKHVTYYRHLFDRHGIRPEQILTIEDLALIPITTRKDLQALPDTDIVMRQVNPASLIPSRSSGSSGRPLTVRRSWIEERLHNAFRWRALRSYGLRATDVHAYVILARPPRAEDNRILHSLAQTIGLGRYVVVSCFQSPGDIVRELRKIRPDVVSGYVSALAGIAHHVDPIELRSLQLRFVGTGGEVLTPQMRELIEEAFGAPIYDTYASIEFNLLAWQCRQTGGLHTCDDGVVMEIMDGARAVREGEEGEVVGTDLHSYAMPMIRYRLGDIATKGRSPCPCGQPFSTIRSIRGRTIDCFTLPDGRVMHPYELGMTSYPWIGEFKVTQERLDRIVMRIVPRSGQDAQEIALLKRSVATRVGPGVDVEVEMVTAIPVEPSGKFSPFRSLLRESESDVLEDNRRG